MFKLGLPPSGVVGLFPFTAAIVGTRLRVEDDLGKVTRK
jgi:hypothetical protein